MNPVRFSSDIQAEGQGATVLIVGDHQFIGRYLSEFFRQQNCRVIFWQDFSRQEVKAIDYIFCLGEKRKDKIEALLKISEKFGAKFLLALFKDEPLTFNLQEIFRRKEIDGRIVELDYTYGPGMDFGKYQEILQLIKVVKIKPVFVADVVYGLVKAMFAAGTTGEVLSLNNQTVFEWQPKTDLEEGLKQTEAWFEKSKQSSKEADQLIENLKPKTEKKQKEKKKKVKRSRSFINFSFVVSIVLFFLILGYPFYSLAFDFFWGISSLRESYNISVSDMAKARKYAESAEHSFGRAAVKFRQLFFLFNLTDQVKLAYRLEKALSVGERTARGVKHLFRVGEEATFLEEVVFHQGQISVERLIGEIRSDLNFAYQEFSFVEAMMNSDPGLWRRAEKAGFNSQISDWIQKLTEVKRLIVQAEKGVSLIPDLIGIEEKKTYLVLLQNNMELRPTGGFIGSYALLTFNKGSLADFEVENVYNADGQLKGHVDPPATLRRSLGEAGWYLRDSNWDPDFPTSAERAAWFLEKETGRGVDGVLGINLFLAQKLLAAVGEVELADYGEKIDAANLFERAEYHAEANFFPGSTQKQDFLGSLARTLFEKVKEADEKTWLAIARVFYQSFEEGDLMVYLTNREAMAVVADLGWDGRIEDLACEGGRAKCLVDYLMVVESNVGVNKANYFVRRKMAHQAKVNLQGQIEKTVKLTYRNTSQSESFPGGRYKNYLRFYLPPGSKIETVMIRDPLTNELVEEISSDRQDVEETHGKKFFGFLVEIPIQEERMVEVTYFLAERLDGYQGQYLLLQQKQPGIRDEDFTFWFTVPEGMTITSVEPETGLAGKTALFTPEFSRDLVFDIRVAR